MHHIFPRVLLHHAVLCSGWFTLGAFVGVKSAKHKLQNYKGGNIIWHRGDGGSFECSLSLLVKLTNGGVGPGYEATMALARVLLLIMRHDHISLKCIFGLHHLEELL